jgi:hypothetical protein
MIGSGQSMIGGGAGGTKQSSIPGIGSIGGT